MILDDILNAALVASNDAAQKPRPRISSSGDPCERAQVLDLLRGKRPMTDIRHVLAAACGTVVGDVIEAGARRLGHWTQEKVEIGGVPGTLDIRLSTKDSVIDLKVVGKKAWKRCQTAPQPKHVIQVNAYAVATNCERWELWYLRGESIWRDALEWRLWHGDADAMSADVEVVQRWRRVTAHATAKTLPEIPREFSPTAFPCGWCHHREQHCFLGT